MTLVRLVLTKIILIGIEIRVTFGSTSIEEVDDYEEIRIGGFTLRNSNSFCDMFIVTFCFV